MRHVGRHEYFARRREENSALTIFLAPTKNFPKNICNGKSEEKSVPKFENSKEGAQNDQNEKRAPASASVQKMSQSQKLRKESAPNSRNVKKKKEHQLRKM